MTMGAVGMLVLGAYSAYSSSKAARDASRAGLEASEIAGELGWAQLDEARRQYADTMSKLQPILDVQTDIMKENLHQARDYYEYGKTFRPLEQDMLGVAMDWRTALQGEAGVREVIYKSASGAAEDMKAKADAFEKDSAGDLALFRGGDKGIYDANKADIENSVGTALADARTGQTAAMNAAIRQGMRYGADTSSMAAKMAGSNASAQAAAANNTRQAEIDAARGRLADTMGLRQSLFGTSYGAQGDAWDRRTNALQNSRNMRLQDEAVVWGRGMDMAGLGRGMVGASQGAYGLAASAGNSAAGNRLQAGNQLMQGLNMGSNTILQGQQMKLGTLNNNANNWAAMGRQGFGDMTGLMGMMYGGGK